MYIVVGGITFHRCALAPATKPLTAAPIVTANTPVAPAYQRGVRESESAYGSARRNPNQPTAMLFDPGNIEFGDGHDRGGDTAEPEV